MTPEDIEWKTGHVAFYPEVPIVEVGVARGHDWVDVVFDVQDLDDLIADLIAARSLLAAELKDLADVA